MKILFIELCNYQDFPTGGHLSFALHMLGAFGNDLKLVGVSTERDSEVGKWCKKEIDGKKYDYFCVACVKKRTKRPLIPSRIASYFQIRRYIKDVLKTNYDKILIQTPEVLFAIPQKYLYKTCLIMPGVENPLRISRYKFAQKLAGIYDWLFFKKAKYASVVMAAADNTAINGFIERSKGNILPNRVRQFPTRYDANIFKIKDRCALRSKYDIDEKTLLYVTVGRLNWFKGWKFMIDCFEKLDNPLAKLVFIGDGEDEQKINDYISEHNLDGRISLIGRKPLDVISDYLNMADAFIMGSYKEGWSTSLVEATACGTPCVVTEFSSASDMIEDGVNGWVIKNRDEKDFVKRMYDVFSLDRESIIRKANEISSLSVQNMREQFLLKTGWYEKS